MYPSQKSCCLIFTLAIIFAITSLAPAELWLPSIFSSNMVIQQKQPCKIWGRTENNAPVTITPSWLSTPQKTTADATGQWQITIAPPTIGGPYQLTITAGPDTVTLDNILCGEVWLCSGQSNMEWSLQNSTNFEEEMKTAEFPQIREFHTQRKATLTSQDDTEAAWKPFTYSTNSGSMNYLSAVGYYFAKELHQKLNVPIGLIESAWGGSSINPWIPIEGYAQVPALKDLYNKIIVGTPGTIQYKKAHLDSLNKIQTWLTQGLIDVNNDKQLADMPTLPTQLSVGHHGDVGLYNGMINPVVGYALKGFIWYQGETNRYDHMLYVEKTRAQVEGWRQVWNNPNMPYYYVQIAPYKYGDESPYVLAEFWEAQTQIMKEVAQTGMVVVSDYTTLDNIHPPHKEPVGKRLAAWALAKDYNMPGICYSGPIFKSIKIEADKIRVLFDYTCGGLQSRDGKELNHFEIASADENYLPAQAEIQGDTVVVASPEIKEPKFVRFAWHKLAVPNLQNAAGLPASAFRSNFLDYMPPQTPNLALGKKVTCNDENTHGWAKGQLTDGSWELNGSHCYATNAGDNFPKHVTLDLDKVVELDKIIFGVPNFGSTKTIEVYISTDNQNFQKIAERTFNLKEDKKIQLAPKDKSARYIRLTYPDHYDEKVSYDPKFVFTTELEVYGK